MIIKNRNRQCIIILIYMQINQFILNAFFCKQQLLYCSIKNTDRTSQIIRNKIWMGVKI